MKSRLRTRELIVSRRNFYLLAGESHRNPSNKGAW